MDRPPKHWAILVGVNDYQEKPLKGCVRDVNMIRQYIESGTVPTKIRLFTAESPQNVVVEDSAGSLQESATHQNVTCCLEQVTRDSRPGDFVYFHFSGHGTSIKFTPFPYSNKRTGDLALVLYNPNQGNPYLRGPELARYLDAMVRRGLKVTVVLDCCFSGSVVRHGALDIPNIRAIKYDPASDPLEQSSAIVTTDCTEEDDLKAQFRDTRVVPRWLIQPSGYTVLAACGPHEQAKEMWRIPGEEHGALSYFLVQSLTLLREQHVQMSHRSLYQQLRAQFCAHWPQQNPMRYGNKDLGFFNELKSSPIPSLVPVFRRSEDGQLCLSAGRAHGVCNNDEYELYRPGMSKIDHQKLPPHELRTKVIAARAVTADLEEVYLGSTVSSEAGWGAKALTSFSLQKVMVTIISDLYSRSQWMAAAQITRHVDLSFDTSEKQPSMYVVSSNKDNSFEVLDGSSKRMESVPLVLSQTPDALEFVLRLLDHMAIYKITQMVENRIPSTSLDQSFNITVVDQHGIDLGLDFVELNHDDSMTLTVKNISQNILYVSICHLDPSWKIESLVETDGGGDHLVMLPNDVRDIGIGVTVPEWLRVRGQLFCEDVLKIFITKSPTSFEPLELPELISNDGEKLPIRGNQGELSRLLQDLATPTRAGNCGILDESWTCRTMVIRTQFKEGAVCV